MIPKTILIVEDEHALATALSLAVRRAGHLPSAASSGAAALESLKRGGIAAAVLDIGLPDMSGLEVLRRLRRALPALPVLVITAHGSLDNAIEAQKHGATQYLVKPLDLRQFSQALNSLVAAADLPAAGGRTTLNANVSGGPLIGGAAVMQEVFVGIARSCSGRMPVLISGPGGSGKSLVARIIHERSNSPGPLQEVPPSDLPDAAALKTLISGAAGDAPGTLVFDDISALPPAVQGAMAARAAASAESGPRMIAICQGDPHRAMMAGNLRADLYYALSPLEIRLPSLRDRSSDIPALAAFFLALRSGDRSPPAITPATLAALQTYPWPGHVRELRHVLDYATTVSQGSPVLPAHLPPHVAACASASPAPSELASAVTRWLDAELPAATGYDSLIDRIETIALSHLLQRHENKPTRLASAMHLNRATLRQKLRRLGLAGDSED